MAEVMQLIEQERKKTDLSAEQFANLVGVTSTTFSRQKRSKQSLGFESFRAYAGYARKTGNVFLLKALLAYVAGLDPDDIEIKRA